MHMQTFCVVWLQHCFYCGAVLLSDSRTVCAGAAMGSSVAGAGPEPSEERVSMKRHID
jgi:hypothetical protein